MNRREFFLAFGGATSWPLAGQAQQAGKILTIAPPAFQPAGSRIPLGDLIQARNWWARVSEFGN
jgi:hypothetical protein